MERATSEPPNDPQEMILLLSHDLNHVKQQYQELFALFEQCREKLETSKAHYLQVTKDLREAVRAMHIHSSCDALIEQEVEILESRTNQARLQRKADEANLLKV